MRWRPSVDDRTARYLTTDGNNHDGTTDHEGQSIEIDRIWFP